RRQNARSGHHRLPRVGSGERASRALAADGRRLRRGRAGGAARRDEEEPFAESDRRGADRSQSDFDGRSAAGDLQRENRRGRNGDDPLRGPGIQGRHRRRDHLGAIVAWKRRDQTARKTQKIVVGSRLSVPPAPFLTTDNREPTTAAPVAPPLHTGSTNAP